MTFTPKTQKMLGIVLGLLMFAISAVLLGTGHPRGFSIAYLGMRQTTWPDGPRPLFVISNAMPFRVTWTMLAPEFELPYGWTSTAPPKVRFGGETLEPGASFEIYGIAATNVAYRYPVLWGVHPADALKRPKWKRVADDWCERLGIRPLFLPYGVPRSPVIPPNSPIKVTGPNAGGPRQSPIPTPLAARVGQFRRWPADSQSRYWTANLEHS